MILPGSNHHYHNNLPFNHLYLLPYEPEANPNLDPLEAVTGFELMVGLMGYTVLWGGRFIANKVITWRRGRLQA
ncbi:MAG: hypothetical protein DPW09_32600 [Anaerolineae bacterium]|nr:hypothetical protein [Anaerolineae bacterium]